MEKILSREEQKIKALECMQELQIYKPYINDFKKRGDGYVCFFEEYAGFWVYQEKEVYEKMKEIERQFDCVVYAITHEYLEFGECYDFLMTSKYPNDKTVDKTEHPNLHIAYAYVWNKTCEWCSEMGSIAVASFGGGLKRIE